MDLTVGQIFLAALNFAPTGAFLCNGQLVSRAASPLLFDLLGTSYGGAGTSSFGVPDVPPIPVGAAPSLSWVIVAEGAPYASGMEALVGEVRLLPVAPPANSTLAQTWLPCNGQVLSISAQQELFALLGNAFGGNGVSTFALPNIPPTTVPNGPPLTSWICSAGQFPPLGGNAITPTPGSNIFDLYLATVLQLPYASAEILAQIDGTSLLRGQTLLISDWTALFSLLGVTYGGNGTTTFLLPDLPAGSNGITPSMVIDGLFPPRG